MIIHRIEREEEPIDEIKDHQNSITIIETPQPLMPIKLPSIPSLPCSICGNNVASIFCSYNFVTFRRFSIH